MATEGKDMAALTAAVEKAVEERTLSLDALKRVAAVREENEALHNRTADATDQRDKARGDRDAALAATKAATAKLEGMEAREKAVAARETAAALQDAVLQGRQSGLDYALNFARDVVRAPIYRTQVDTPVVMPGQPATPSNQYPSGPYVTQGKGSTERTQE